MDEVLRGLDFCFAYLDDILVFSRSLEEHEQHLRALFGRLQTYGIIINPMKCIFRASEVTFPGYQVSAVGSRPHPATRTTRSSRHGRLHYQYWCRAAATCRLHLAAPRLLLQEADHCPAEITAHTIANCWLSMRPWSISAICWKRATSQSSRTISLSHTPSSGNGTNAHHVSSIIWIS
jgi:hypothetical protein